MGGRGDLGDMDHEEYYNNPSAARKTVRQTLGAFNMEGCCAEGEVIMEGKCVKEVKIPALKWDNYPQPQWCPMITKVESDGFCGFIETTKKLDDGTNILLDCLYSPDRGGSCLGDDKCYLSRERMYVPVSSDYAEKHGWEKEYSLSEFYENIETSIRSLYLTEASRYYLGEWKETKDLDYYEIRDAVIWECK
jgi:hypothetical protein